MIKGHIQYDPTIWCGRCGQWEPLLETGKHFPARKAAIKAGWKYTRADGWICRDCQKDESES